MSVNDFILFLLLKVCISQVRNQELFSAGEFTRN